MKVKFRTYETPQPEDAQREPLTHARVQTRGTVHLDEMCDELRELGINSAQIKAVLDASQRFIYRSLHYGYNVELDGIGTFSLSLRTKPFENAEGEKMMQVKVDNLNFRCNKKLKAKIQDFELEQIKPESKAPTLLTRKKRMITYLEKHGCINTLEYTAVNNCSYYQARKDLAAFLDEGLLFLSGKGSHKIYLLKGE